MTGHDQLFKDLFGAFPGDLLRLVAPELAGEMEVERFEPLPQETFTDLPAGARREMDLVGRVPPRGREGAWVLVNVEAEGEARAALPQRLRRYAMQLELRYDLPVVSIVVYRRGGPPGVTRQSLGGAGPGEPMGFHYYAWGLSGSPAEQYLARPEPLAWALAALMRRGRLSRARHKFECLKRIAAAEVDEARRFLLVNCVETYIEWKGGERGEYEKLVAAKGGEDVAILEMTWADKLEAKGEAKGRREGRREGEAALLRRQLERRFGPLGAARSSLLERADAERLLEWGERVLTARSVEEVFDGALPGAE